MDRMIQAVNTTEAACPTPASPGSRGPRAVLVCMSSLTCSNTERGTRLALRRVSWVLTTYAPLKQHWSCSSPVSQLRDLGDALRGALVRTTQGLVLWVTDTSGRGSF